MSGVEIAQYLLGFGPAVFLPIIITLVGLAVKLPFGRAFRSGLLMGVGFLGINLVISGLFYAQIAPAATAMVEHSGAQLDMTDMSWAPMAAITWAWPIAILMWPIQIGINLAMLALGWTKTMNVDMWCVFVKSFIAMLIVKVTGNVGLAFALASVQVVLELKMGDWISYLTHEYTGIPGITVPHLAALGCMLAAPVNWVMERIPGLNRIKTDPQAIRDRLGMFGEPMLIGWIIGIALGIAAGYQFREVVVLSVAAAAALVTMPMMARLFMESLAPVSEAATTFMRKRLPGREIFIGLDWPVLAGNPATYGAGLLAIPLMIFWMLFLPGNHTLIFGAIADWAWIISPIAVMMGGDVLRILIASGVVMIPVYLWTSTYVGPIISAAAAGVGQALPEGVSTLTWFGTPPLNMALLKIADLNLESVAWAAGVVVLFVLAWKLMPRWNNQAKERLIGEGKLAGAEAVAEAAAD